jgi:hypothetical protein
VNLKGWMNTPEGKKFREAIQRKIADEEKRLRSVNLGTPEGSAHGSKSQGRLEAFEFALNTEAILALIAEKEGVV